MKEFGAMGQRNYCVLVAAGVASIWFGGATTSNAQVQRYQPARPTVSPYLNLFREQSGALPNYQALVRPLQLQNDLNRQQKSINQSNALETARLQTEIYNLQLQQAADLQMAPTGKASWFQRPSQRNQFMNTSRFYSQSGSARSTR